MEGRVDLKPERCMACGQCLDICESGALQITSKAHGYARVEKDESKCTNCFKCLTDIDCSGNAFVWVKD